MPLFFSPSTCGFYDDRFNTEIPDDAMEITPAERKAALDALEPGKAISAGPDSKPIAAVRALSAKEAMAALRRKRNKLLDASDRILGSDFPITREERAAWMAWRDTMRQLPEAFAADPASVVWPEPPTEGVLR